MANILQNLFSAYPGEENSQKSTRTKQKIYIATYALFFEMATIDGQFSPEEKQQIINIFRIEYGLDEQELELIGQEAEQELKNSNDLWKFTNLINQELSAADKIKIVELIWKIIYADGHLNRYEDYLIHKLSRLLNLGHRELINAKLDILNDNS